MSYIRYSLLCSGRTNKTRINEVNVLINKALKCIHCKIYDESVRNLKITKRILSVEKLIKYKVGVFMYKFKKMTFYQLTLSVIVKIKIKYIII